MNPLFGDPYGWIGECWSIELPASRGFVGVSTLLRASKPDNLAAQPRGLKVKQANPP